MKTTFELEIEGFDNSKPAPRLAMIYIYPKLPKKKTYVSISLFETLGHSGSLRIKDKDLERFARNILKALGK